MSTNNTAPVTIADFVSSDEAAEMLNIKKSTLYRMVRAKKLVARGPSRNYVFLRADILAVLLAPKEIFTRNRKITQAPLV